MKIFLKWLNDGLHFKFLGSIKDKNQEWIW